MVIRNFPFLCRNILKCDFSHFCSKPPVYHNSWKCGMGWGHFFISFLFQCDSGFQCSIYVSKIRKAILLLSMFHKLAFVVSTGQNAAKGTISAVVTNFFSKKTTATGLQQTINDVIRRQRLNNLWCHRKILLLLSILYPHFNNILRKFQLNGLLAPTFCYTLNKSSKWYIVYICRVFQKGLFADEFDR